MNCWTIYRSPRDYPNQYVVRRHWIGVGQTKATDDMFVADTLEEARALLPIGLLCFPRHPNDDPVIVESWM